MDSTEVLAKYPLGHDDSASVAFAAVTSDVAHCRARAFNQLMTRRGVPVYAYVFADTTAPFYFSPASFPPGATHTLEMQYFFPLYHGAQGTPKPLNGAQERLSDHVVSYWTTFARTGDPNSPETPPWPRFAEADDPFQLLLLPAPIAVTDFDEQHNCAFWARLGGVR